MKAIKRIKLCLISVFAVIFASTLCAFFTFNANAAKADAATGDVFVMDDSGLTLRLTDGAGIRFKVKMNESVKTQIDNNEITLKFLVAPRAVFDAAKDFNAIVTAATSATGSKVPAKIMVADKGRIYSGDDGFYYANVVISNVLVQNRTLDMCALAYYVKDGANTFATVNYEKVRGNLYGVVNATALINEEYAKSVFASEELSWFGTANYPVNVETNEQAETLKAAQDGGTDLSQKVILAKNTVTVPAGMESVIKTVSETNLDGTTEIVLASTESYAANVGAIEGTVVKATIGGKVVSFADGNVILNADFKARLVKHGEQTLTLTVENNGQYTNVNKNLRIVTKEISTLNELKTAFTANANNAKYGYYRLKKDIDSVDWFTSEYSDSWTVAQKNNSEIGFRGTFDGNNKTITSWFYKGGLLGVIGNGALIKNLNVAIRQYQGGNTSLNNSFGYSMIGATMDTVTVSILKGSSGIAEIPAGKSGLLTCMGAYNNTLKNVNINVEDFDIDTLFGTCHEFTYPENYVKNKYEGCTVKAKSLKGLECTNYTNKTVTTAMGVSGLTVIVPRADETATEKLTIGQAYEYALADVAEITEIKLGENAFTAYTFNGGVLTINADAFNASDVSTKTFAITAKNEKGYFMYFNLTVAVDLDATPVNISGTKEIVLTNGNDYALDLGEYSRATAHSVTIGGENATYNNGTLTLSDEYKANQLKHGEQPLVMIVEKDGAYYRLTATVLVVTKEISTFDELKSALYLSYKNNVTVRYGYYRLIENLISGNWYQSGYDGLARLASNPENGFRGTFDGNGKNIQEFIAEPGIFGIIGNGALIKNLTITLNQYNSNFMALGFSMIGATLNGVTINAKARTAGGTLYDGITQIPDGADSGLVTSMGAYNNNFINVTVNASDVNVDTLFGSCAYGYSYPAGYTENTFTGCTVKVKSLLGLACTNNADKTVTPYTGVSGLDVYINGAKV